MITLEDYQEAAAERLLSRKRYILGDEVGVGKTFAAIHAANEVPERKLIIVPAYLQQQWEHEIRRYCGEDTDIGIATGNPHQRMQVIKTLPRWLIISYNMVGQSAKGRYPLHNTRYGSIIFDEAHRLRSRNSKWTKASYKLMANYKWMVTGTPIKANSGDVWPLLKMCDPKKFSSYWKFIEHFCKIIENPWSRKCGALKPEKAEEFHELLSQYMLRRTLEDVGIDLAKPIFFDIPTQLGTSVRRTYDTAKKDYIIRHPDLSKPEAVQSAGALITKLRLLVNDPPTQDHPKVTALKGVLEDHDNEPVIIFTWHKAVRDRLAAQVKTQRKRPKFVVDDLSKRHETIQKWNKSPNGLLFATLGAIGEGANLQHGATIVLVEEDWLETTQEQAIARCRRKGQTKAVRVYRIFSTKTVDEKIIKVAKARGEDAQRALMSELFML